MTLIKMCGMRTVSDIKNVNSIHPDCIGYIFYEKSRRNVSLESAVEMTSVLDSDIIPVGVFVDAEPERIESIVNSGCIRAIQLHGNESEEYVSDIRKRCLGTLLIKTFIIRTRNDIKRANLSNADMVLLDAGMGSGKTFDWDLVKGMKRPYILSGGLDPSNISDAIKELGPYGVDVSSGIETDGVKDPEKMALFKDRVNATKDPYGPDSR